MATYQASVILQTLTIKANSEAEAELKYDAWHLSEACPSCFPLDAKDCGCVEEDDEIGHTMELIAEESN